MAADRVICPYCDHHDPAFLRALAAAFPVCTHCGRIIPVPVEPESADEDEPADDARVHPSELLYAQTPVTKSDERKPIVINAHDLLDYAGALAGISRRLEEELSTRSESAAIGFMTGSYGLLFLTKLRMGAMGQDRIFWADGLKHPTLAEAEPKFHKILDQLDEKGTRRFVIVDEMVGGTQIRTALYSIARWALARGRSPCVRVVAAFKGTQSAATAQLRDTLKRRGKTKPWPETLTGEVFATRRLFEKDTDGNLWRGLAWSIEKKSYYAVRENPGPMHIRCPNLLTGGACGSPASVGSHDQLFGSTIRQIVGALRLCPHVWPETIERYDCDECKQLLRAARAAYGNVQGVPGFDGVAEGQDKMPKLP